MNRRHISIAVTYSLTVLISAFLLFVIQPMASALVLPDFGGSSAVWTTSMFFFQIMLLAGYLYAHGIAQNFAYRRQVLLHGGLMALALFFLPVGIPEDLLFAESAPAFHLLLALFFGIGLPTFVVSSSAPLFQHWFGALDHPHADDPYYLYAASNVGSMTALLSYPFLIDRFYTLDTQKVGWTAGFLGLAVFVGICGYFVYRSGEREAPEEEPSIDGLPLKRKAWWLLVTFIPSSLMLGVTHYMTTDIASVPLLWVLPLAAYLLSFILVFARLRHPLGLYRIVLPPALLAVFALTFAGVLSHVTLLGLQLVAFFLVSMYFHGELAEDRPETEHLTTFFIFVALGGSLGGIFNAIVAPLLFDSIAEYFLVLALAITVAGWLPEKLFSKRYNFKNAAYVLFVLLAGSSYLYVASYDFWAQMNRPVLLAVSVGTLFLLYVCYRWPILINLALGGVFLFGFSVHEKSENVINSERSFYGHYKIKDLEDGRSFMHGTTQHGFQPFRDGEPVNAATSYYHPDGPVGDIALSYRFDRVGVAGLGIGGLAAYAPEESSMEFFEIDPTVERLARTYFGYLDDCGKRCSVRIGDARQLIQNQPDQSYDVLIMDAYTSDAVPTHLLTREAVQMYITKVRKTGVVAFHVSNRHLNLEGVVGAIAKDLDLATQTREYYPPLNKPRASGSTYVVVGRTEEALRSLKQRQGWEPTEVGSTLWTDRHRNIVAVLEDKSSSDLSTPTVPDMEQLVPEPIKNESTDPGNSFDTLPLISP